MPNPRSILQTFALKAVLLWMICHSSLCLAENATVTGVVNYRGVIPGPTYVWALEANGTKAAESILPDGNGTYALSLLKGRGYDFKVFVDGSQNGYPTTGEVWKHYTDWNNSLGGYNLTQIDGNISGIDFSLLDQDSDNDGFLNWHEFKAGTQDNNASSTPPLNFGLIAHWTFDETNGTVLHDSTANEINGTMHGFTNPWNPGREGVTMQVQPHRLTLGLLPIGLLTKLTARCFTIQRPMKLTEPCMDLLIRGTPDGRGERFGSME